MSRPGVVASCPNPIKMLIFAILEGVSNMGFMSVKSFLGGCIRGETRAFDQGLHHRELNASNPLEASLGKVPGFAGPKEGLSHATLIDAKPVGEGGFCQQTTPRTASWLKPSWKRWQEAAATQQ